MSVPVDPADSTGLDACGCCEAGVPPPRIFNRPGLPALAYRVDTHPTALRRMLAGLATAERGGEGADRHDRPLRALTTRATDDPAIALLDAWATVTDVLTFYQERIANEGFLRTATERASVLGLARAIGYELNPGVAAGAHLAFTVEDAPGAPGVAAVPEGTKVQSIPGQGQHPQTFETTEAIEARREWNGLRPRSTEAQPIGLGTTEVFLEGIATQLQPGDALLFVGDERAANPGSERWDVRTVRTVVAVPPDPRNPEDPGHTVVGLGSGLGSVEPGGDPAVDPRVYVFRQRAALFGHNAPDWRTMPDSIKEMWDPTWDRDNPDRRKTQWPNFEIQTIDQRLIDLDAEYPKVLAGSWLLLSRPGYQELYRAVAVETTSRTDFALTAKTTRIEVDAREHLSWFELRETTVFAQSEELRRAERPLLTPVGFSRDEELAAEAPAAPDGRELVLDRLVSGLTPGRALIVTGKRPRVEVAASGLTLTADDDSGQAVTLQPGDVLHLLRPLAPPAGAPAAWRLVDRDGFAGTVVAAPGGLLLRAAAPDDPTVSEVVAIADDPTAIRSGRQRTSIELRAPLQHAFDPASVTINANVARATHGETIGGPVFGGGPATAGAAPTPTAPTLRGEPLGSGNGAIPNQQFALKRPPLTYVSAPTPSGARSTLAVRVNGSLWQEVPSLFGLSPRSESYTVRVDAEGTTRVIFGDGEMGARLPTGAENVTATYRTGIGLAGSVPAGALSLLQVRPLGIRSVTNPLPATGAADPEALEDARTNAPLTVLTLDRVVSLRDFEDFARAFAGIGKAQGVALWQGTTRIVHVTVAGVGGAEVPASSDLYRNLRRAISAQRDPSHRVEVASYARRRFSLKARLRVDPRLVPEQVFANVVGALRVGFSFERRAFGQPATAAEVIAIAQGVEGVVGVDLDWLQPDDPPAPPDAAQPVPVLPARTAHLLPDGTIAPAELLLVNPDGISLKAMTP